MKILSWNVNGLRSIYKKGFLEWLKNSEADTLCLQEIKSREEHLPRDLFNPGDYFSYFNPAKRPGYAGIAVFTKEKPLKIESKIGFEKFDREGRIMLFQYPNFLLINLYLPHGGRQKENLYYKIQSYKSLFNRLSRMKNEKVVLLGDFNIAHQEIDLARPKNNQSNIMFTPEERKKITRIITLGFTDTFRKFHKDRGHYTWWPYFAKARERNLGWRIDYVFTSKKLTPKVKNAFILDKVIGSDHCPIGIEISC